MAAISPLRNIHTDQDASFFVFGEAKPIEVVATYGAFELEYAAIRRGAAIIDQPNRAAIELTGPDRIDFLNRMLTQQLDGFAPGDSARSFWLSRKGRIVSDLRIVHLEDRTLLDLDAHTLESTLQTLDSYLFSEDAEMKDVSATTHRIGVHGPRALDLLRDVTENAELAIEVDHAATVSIDGRDIAVDRQDALGVPGFEIHCKIDDAEPIWLALASAGATEGSEEAGPHRQRPIGWSAWNTARIEAGWPILNADFGPDSLPAETGVLHDRVSFKKGCYLGQEIVARMESRAALKQCLVAIKMESKRRDESDPTPLQPLTGEAVFGAGDDQSTPIGAVTSSTISPMLGDTPICFAQAKASECEPGAHVIVEAQGERLEGEVLEGLAFLHAIETSTQ